MFYIRCHRSHCYRIPINTPCKTNTAELMTATPLQNRFLLPSDVTALTRLSFCTPIACITSTCSAIIVSLMAICCSVYASVSKHCSRSAYHTPTWLPCLCVSSKVLSVYRTVSANIVSNMATVAVNGCGRIVSILLRYTYTVVSFRRCRLSILFCRGFITSVNIARQSVCGVVGLTFLPRWYENTAIRTNAVRMAKKWVGFILD